MDYSTYFKYPAQPASAERIAEFEHALGKTFPNDYKLLLAQTGGGTLSSKNCFLGNIPLPDGGTTDVVAREIFGNGKTRNGLSVDLIDDVSFLIEEWEIPDEVLLIAVGESGMHECFVINYDLPDYPRGAVLYVDTEFDGITVPVADSLDTFLSQLAPHPYSVGTSEDSGQDDLGIQGVRYGALSESLTDAIAKTPTPDIEKLLRKVTEPITNALSPAITGDTKEGRRFLDVAYWLIQHVEPQYDPETYACGGRDGQKAVLLEMMGNSFKVPGQKYGFGFTQAVINMWWEHRLEEGVLKETKNGFILDEEYMDRVLNDVRRETQ